ncbi:MAG: TSUP family transporter [Pedobacter sp.]
MIRAQSVGKEGWHEIAALRGEQQTGCLVAAVVLYLLVAMLAGRKGNSSSAAEASVSRPNRLLVTGSSFFTGILSVGTSNWLIPHMVRRLRMPVSQAVATGIFVMFSTAIIFWLLIVASVMLGWRDWPQNPPILFGTVPGVILGGQIGSRLIRFPRLKHCQSAVFVGVLVLSASHMIWEFFRRG